MRATSYAHSADIRWLRLRHLSKRDTFVDEHDGNVFAYGIENLIVGSYQAPIELFRDRFLRLIFQRPALDGRHSFFESAHRRPELTRLLRFRATENG